MKKCLAVLLQHRVLSYTPRHGRSMQYSISVTAVFNRILFPRYIMMARGAVGEVGELIVEDLLQHGQSTMAQVQSPLSVCHCTDLLLQSALRVVEQLKDVGTSERDTVIRSQFKLLVDKRFLTSSDGAPAELVQPVQQSPAAAAGMCNKT